MRELPSFLGGGRTRWWVSLARSPAPPPLRGKPRSLPALLALLALLMLGSLGCSVGHGEGDISGTVALGACRAVGPYELRPNTFFAQSVEELLRIRVQRGSDVEVASDGLAVLVRDASRVKQELLGVDIDLASEQGEGIEVTVYFNDTCPPGRDQIPIVLRATGGIIRFESIYAPKVDDGVRIHAELSDLRFEDPDEADRWAALSGYFNFLYVRGRPAQRYP